MLEELLNSKMFLLAATAILGFLIGALIKGIRGSKQRSVAFTMPIIGLILTALILKYVKLNVAYFELRYTLMGIAGMALISLAFGYIMFMYNEKKTPYPSTVIFIYTCLAIVSFYIFFKPSLKLDISYYPSKQDVLLLLKNEDAGYYEINEQGIGYIGSQLFTDGFRPNFEGSLDADDLYEPTPYAVEINTKNGIAHALWFKSKSANHEKPELNLDDLIEKGIVKPGELQFGDLNSKKK